MAELRTTSSRSVSGDPTQHVRALLGNFRLLEAAGACGLIAGHPTQDRARNKPPEWWDAVAASARGYRSAVHQTVLKGFSAIDEWSQSRALGSDAELANERARLNGEHRKWLCEVPGGQAYVAWLSAYVAVAELDGERALRSLDRCAAIVREFVDAPGLGGEPSTYDFLQSAADTLVSCLTLPEHPLRDVRRFAFLPSPLRTG